MKNNYQCVIIGSGVAGMTAALYLKRLNIDVLVIEENIPGGQIVNTSVIENYPGFQKIDGATLASNIYSQLTNIEIPYSYSKVIRIENSHTKKNIITNNGNFTCDTIIIATGRQPKKLGLKNEDRLIGHGLSYCAICDGMLYKNKNVAVVGGGNSAFEESLYLASICSKVTILIRKDKAIADPILIDKIEKLENVEIKYNAEVKELCENNNQLTKIKLNNQEELEISGLFIFIGLQPKLEFLVDSNIKIINNYIEVDEKMQTNIENIYACGDVIKKDVYQITTAVGEATVAAINVSKKLK